MAPHRESPAVLLGLLERLEAIEALGFTDWSPLAEVHPATRRLLAGWGYHHDAWSLRRFQPPKRYAVLLCFLQAALAETADAVVEAQDKLITSIHAKAKKRREALLRASEEAKRRAVEVLEVMGELVLDETIPDAQLRSQILWQIPSEEMTTLVVCSRLHQTTSQVGWQDASLRDSPPWIRLAWLVSSPISNCLPLGRPSAA